MATEITAIPSLPPRDPEAHKGDFGHLLVLAGSPRMTGAALLAVRAGLRAGAGLVTLGMPAAIHVLVAPAMLEGMALPLPCTSEGAFSEAAVLPVLDFLNRATAACLGPGITSEDETVLFVSRVIQRTRAPLVLDADGLNCLAKAPNMLRAAAGPRILTPHPGEAARLLGCPTAAIQADRHGAAETLARRYGAIVVLKGRGTVVSDGTTHFVNRTGNPGMATGGAGDVLTGLIGGLLAQHIAPFDAAILGVHLHGLAGDLAAARVGIHALIAGDILEHLPAALRTME
ncbi:MAG: NAD(P)H-hydrate dehydratase [Planctomycetes bacterium]|jgi:NAD(P)H-hydrate epimerase|nr:NAD(P)H-hydrate dehydratase [Planctomycetota bacterium]